MMYIRFFDNKNRTLGEVKYYLEAKSVGIADMISLG